MQTKKQNKNVLVGVGLDTIQCDIPTEYELMENEHVFVSPKTGIEIGRLTRKQGQERGYRLNLCLPKCIRQDNVKPFTVLDAFHLYEVGQMITVQMQELFGKSFPQLYVSTAEVNATAELENNVIVESMLKLLSLMFLSAGEKLFVCVRGTKTGKRYDNVSSLPSGAQIESLRTPRTSNSRFSWKYYSKSIEQGIEDRGILRLESIYNRRGLDFARTGKTLFEFLSIGSIKSLLKTYRTDYRSYVIERYWNNSGHPFYEQIVEIIKKDIVSYKHPVAVALMNRQLVEIDFKLFKKACYAYYDKRNSANKAISRVRRSGEITITEGVIDAFVALSRAIVYG